MVAEALTQAWPPVQVAESQAVQRVAWSAQQSPQVAQSASQKQAAARLAVVQKPPQVEAEAGTLAPASLRGTSARPPSASLAG